MRRALRGLSTVLIVAGALLLADAGATVVWQEPVSALLAQLSQNGLGGDLDDLGRDGLTGSEQRVLDALRGDEERLAFLSRSFRRRIGEGQAAGRIALPTIGEDFVVVDGTTPGALRKGPGFFPENPLPGAGGTVAIAGHRTTYGAPFRSVDDLDRGDPIVVEMPYGRFEYRVEGSRIVDPGQTEVVRRVGYDRLVLSACHPLYSAAQRIVVFARLVRTTPVDAVRAAVARRSSAS